MKHLIVYHELTSDEIISGFYQLIESHEDQIELKEKYYELIRALKMSKQTLEERLFHKMITTEHPILSAIQHGKVLKDSDLNCLHHDLEILRGLINTPIEPIVESVGDGYNLLGQVIYGVGKPMGKAYELFFNEYDGQDIKAFIELIKTYGTGVYALNQAFYLDEQVNIVPIEDFSPLPWNMIYGYDLEKEKLMKNTITFINGLPCHNALLVGASGTGKSSSVKAIIKHYEKEGLRLVQLGKSQLRHLPTVINRLGQSAFKFILFIDDLSFEVNEDDYKFMKSFIEGGITNEAKNVLFYITSNRRHLIKEIRSERENDIHLNDFIQEMTSLSDRFGLTLFYQPPEQKLYLEMCKNMLTELGVRFDEDILLLEAKRWSLRHGGMSGRVAEQFVKHYKMNLEV